MQVTKEKSDMETENLVLSLISAPYQLMELGEDSTSLNLSVLKRTNEE